MHSNSIRIALDVVADYWTALLFREMFMGATQWTEFQNNLEIPPSTLKRKLTFLIKSGCVEKLKRKSSRVSSYQLTEMGKDLFPFQMASREWQIKWDRRPGVFLTPWVHRCGTPLRCRDMCNACGAEIESTTIRLRDDMVTETAYSAPSARHQRGSGETPRDARAPASTPPKVIEVIGNRRSSLTMAAILRGKTRFHDILEHSQLPPATLADRLKRLQLLNLVHSRLYQRRPDRHEYIASESGSDLILLSLQLLKWSNRWLRGMGAGATSAVHTTCDQAMESVLVCAHCGEAVALDDCHLDTALAATA